MLIRMIWLLFFFVCPLLVFADTVPSSLQNMTFTVQRDANSKKEVVSFQQLNTQVDNALSKFDAGLAGNLIFSGSASLAMNHVQKNDSTTNTTKCDIEINRESPRLDTGVNQESPQGSHGQAAAIQQCLDLERRAIYLNFFYNKVDARYHSGIKESRKNKYSHQYFFEPKRFDQLNELYGHLAMDTQHYQIAEQAFRRLMASQIISNHSKAEVDIQMQLAQALYAQGQRAEAIKELNEANRWASQLGGPSSQKMQITHLLSALKPPVRKSTLQGSVGVKTGYDSNLNTSTEDDTISFVIPSVGVLTSPLAPEDQARASPFANVNVSGFGSLPIWQTTTLFAQGSVDGTNNAKASDLNTRTFSAAGGANILFGADNTYELTVPLQAQHLLLGGNHFADALIGVVDLSKHFSRNIKAGVYAEHDTILFTGHSERNVNINLGGLSSTNYFGGIKTRLVSKLYYGQQRPISQNVFDEKLGRNFYGVNLQAQWRGNKYFLPYTGLVLQKAKHLGPELPYSYDARDENFMDVSLGLTYSYAPESPWKLNAQYDYINNQSNLSIHTYKRQLVSVGATYTFGS